VSTELRTKRIKHAANQRHASRLDYRKSLRRRLPELVIAVRQELSTEAFNVLLHHGQMSPMRAIRAIYGRLRHSAPLVASGRTGEEQVKNMSPAAAATANKQ